MGGWRVLHRSMIVNTAETAQTTQILGLCAETQNIIETPREGIRNLAHADFHSCDSNFYVKSWFKVLCGFG